MPAGTKGEELVESLFALAAAPASRLLLLGIANSIDLVQKHMRPGGALHVSRVLHRCPPLAVRRALLVGVVLASQPAVGAAPAVPRLPHHAALCLPPPPPARAVPLIWVPAALPHLSPQRLNLHPAHEIFPTYIRAQVQYNNESMHDLVQNASMQRGPCCSIV